NNRYIHTVKFDASILCVCLDIYLQCPYTVHDIKFNTDCLVMACRKRYDNKMIMDMIKINKIKPDTKCILEAYKNGISYDLINYFISKGAKVDVECINYAINH